MGFISTTRTVVYSVVAVGVVGFSTNAVILYLLRENIKRLEEEITSLRQIIENNIHRSLPAVASGRTSSGHRVKFPDSESDDDFQLALESIPSQTALVREGDQTTLCTDSDCDTELRELCATLDKQHDVLKLSEEGCREGLARIQSLNSEKPDTPQLMWRFVRAMYEQSKHFTKNKTEAERLLMGALQLAQKGVELADRNSKCHLWYAILLGDTCKFDDTKTKLTKGREFEKHVKKSLQLDPCNSTALHLLGRYCYEVASIKWWEARVAATLFGSVPQSSYEEALQYFQRAHEINEEWQENTIFLVKCLVALGRKEEAEKWLCDLKSQERSDEVTKQIEELSGKL